MVNPLKAVQRGYTRKGSWEEYSKSGAPPFELKWGTGIGVEQVFDLLGIDKDSITSTLETVDDVTSVVTSALDILESVVDILALVLGASLDIFAAFIEALKLILNSLINVVTGISVSVLYHFPQTPKSRRNPDEIIYDIGMAYLDERDGNRPLTVSENFGVAILAMWSLPNLESLLSIFGRLKSAFEKTNLNASEAAARYSSVSEVFNTDTILKASEGTSPDFFGKYDLVQYGAIRDFIRLMSEAINSLSAKKARAEAIREIIELARRRIALVVDKLQAVLDAINGIAQLLAFGDANSVLLLSGTGKSEDFANAIINSVNHKDYPRSKLGDTIDNPLVDRGIVSASRTNNGKQMMYSGAFLLHAQMANPVADAGNLVRIFTSLVNQVEQTTTKVDQANQRVQKSKDRFTNAFSGDEDYNANGFGS